MPRVGQSYRIGHFQVFQHPVKAPPFDENRSIENQSTYNAEVVYDKDTKLEWVAGPLKDVSWNEAKQWAENLTTAGGGWQMPTREELRTLYKKLEDEPGMTLILKATGGRFVWSSEIKDSTYSYGVYLKAGSEGSRDRTKKMDEALLCVIENNN